MRASSFCGVEALRRMTTSRVRKISDDTDGAAEVVFFVIVPRKISQGRGGTHPYPVYFFEEPGDVSSILRSSFGMHERRLFNRRSGDLLPARRTRVFSHAADSH
jgi:hypothetical protein